MADELGRVQLEVAVDLATLQTQLQSVKTEIEKLPDVEVGLKIDKEGINSQLNTISRQFQKRADYKVGVSYTSLTNAAEAAKKLKSELDSLNSRKDNVAIELDLDTLNRQVSAVDALLEDLHDAKPIQLKIDTGLVDEAAVSVDRLLAQLRETRPILLRADTGNVEEVVEAAAKKVAELRALPPVLLRFDPGAVAAAVDAVNDAINTLRQQAPIPIRFDTKQVSAAAAGVEDALDILRRQEPIPLKFDLAPLQAAIRAVDEAIDTLKKQEAIRLPIDVALEPARAELAAFRKEASVPIPVALDLQVGTARQEVDTLTRTLAGAAAQLPVDLQTDAARTELTQLRQQAVAPATLPLQLDASQAKTALGAFREAAVKPIKAQITLEEGNAAREADALRGQVSDTPAKLPVDLVTDAARTELGALRTDIAKPVAIPLTAKPDQARGVLNALREAAAQVSQVPLQVTADTDDAGPKISAIRGELNELIAGNPYVVVVEADTDGAGPKIDAIQQQLNELVSKNPYVVTIDVRQTGISPEEIQRRANEALAGGLSGEALRGTTNIAGVEQAAATAAQASLLREELLQRINTRSRTQPNDLGNKGLRQFLEATGGLPEGINTKSVRADLQEASRQRLQQLPDQQLLDLAQTLRDINAKLGPISNASSGGGTPERRPGTRPEDFQALPLDTVRRLRDQMGGDFSGGRVTARELRQLAPEVRKAVLDSLEITSGGLRDQPPLPPPPGADRRVPGSPPPPPPRDRGRDTTPAIPNVVDQLNQRRQVLSFDFFDTRRRQDQLFRARQLVNAGQLQLRRGETPVRALQRTETARAAAEFRLAQRRFQRDQRDAEQAAQAQARQDAIFAREQEQAQKRAAGRQAARNRRFGDAASNALIGGAFPALFGQGLGASAGGAIGGAVGSLVLPGAGGFAGSLIGTAGGAAFDASLGAVDSLAKAMNDPIKAFQELQQAALLSSKAVEKNAGALIEAGRAEEAAAQIRLDLLERYGSVEPPTQEFDNLKRDFAELGVTLAQLAAGPLAQALTATKQFVANFTFVPRKILEALGVDLLPDRQATPEQLAEQRQAVREARTRSKAVFRTSKELARLGGQPDTIANQERAFELQLEQNRLREQADLNAADQTNKIGLQDIQQRAKIDRLNIKAQRDAFRRQNQRALEDAQFAGGRQIQDAQIGLRNDRETLRFIRPEQSGSELAVTTRQEQQQLLLNRDRAFQDLTRAQDRNASPAEIETATSAFKTAQLEYERGVLRSAKALSTAATQIQESLRGVTRQREDTQTGLIVAQSGPDTGINKFLSPQARENRQADAERRLTAEANDVAQRLGVQATFRGNRAEQNAQKAEFIQAGRQELRGNEDLATLDQKIGDLTTSLTDVKTSIEAQTTAATQLKEATDRLTGKNWNVYVNVNSGSVGGDGRPAQVAI